MKLTRLGVISTTVLLCSCAQVKPLKPVMITNKYATPDSFVMLCSDTNKINVIFTNIAEQLVKEQINVSVKNNEISASKNGSTITMSYQCKKRMSYNTTAFNDKLTKYHCNQNTNKPETINDRLANCLTENIISSLNLNPRDHNSKVLTAIFPLVKIVVGDKSTKKDVAQVKTHNQHSSTYTIVDMQGNSLTTSFTNTTQSK